MLSDCGLFSHARGCVISSLGYDPGIVIVDCGHQQKVIDLITAVWVALKEQ